MNEIDANQIHEICEMADKSLNSLMPALLLSSHLHSPQCASPLQRPLKLWPFDTTTSHATKKKEKEKEKKREREREREREGVPCFQLTYCKLAFIRVIA